MAKKKKKIKAGDKVLVHWLDIQESVAHEPIRARPAPIQTLGYFIEWKGTGKERTLVISYSFDKEQNEYLGWCAFPAGCVIGVEPA